MNHVFGEHIGRTV
jgi:hypothetical protein